MGNWRTVRIVGTCPRTELYALECAVKDENNFGPLTASSGLCGLGSWPAVEMDRVGNLAERDFSVESIAVHLGELVKRAPGLRLKVHCGGDYENERCVATIGARSAVIIGPPEVEQIGTIPEDQMLRNLQAAMLENAAERLRRQR